MAGTNISYAATKSLVLTRTLIEMSSNDFEYYLVRIAQVLTSSLWYNPGQC